MNKVSQILLLSFCLLAFGCSPTQTITDPPTGTGGSSTGGSVTGGTTGGTCSTNCSGKQCGPDGCGSFCGVCGAGTACNAQGICQKNQCAPKCSGKQCGPDGCGGTCGSCSAGKACNGAGQCTTGGSNNCLPNCVGKVCGNDGCGNLCGKCPPGQACTLQGQCKADNSACGGIDTIGECQQDNTIAVTCKAGKLIAVICDPAKGLVCAYNAVKNKYDCVKSGCSPSCFGKQCGPDGCGGLCGQCQPNQSCNASGKCQSGTGCQPSCANKQCGPDGCGSLCGICPGGQKCGATGLCVSTSDCTPNCSGKQCGPNGCGSSCGTCPPNLQCSGSYKCVATGCSPNCTGKVCGSDGCGGSCGLCPTSQTCDSAGHCVTVAGGSCGNLTYEGACTNGNKTVTWCESGAVESQDCTAYGPNFVCAWVEAEEYYWCLDQCDANCANKDCGDNGCGGSCGTCLAGKTCNSSGQCKTSGGGGECGNISFEGTCEGLTLKFCSNGKLVTFNCGQYGKICKWDPNANGGNGWYACMTSDTGCTPNCIITVDNQSVPKECGDDGCGNACGVCEANQVCDEGLCINTGTNNCGNVTATGKCDGDIYTYCLNGNLSTQDCAATNQTCENLPPPQADYGCKTPEGGGGCGNKVTEKGLCIGNTVTYCINSSVTTSNCSDISLYCMFNPGADKYQCLGNSGCENSCSADTRCQKDGTCGCDGIDINGVCENTTLVWCSGSKLTIENCTLSNETCEVSDSGFADCKDTGVPI